MIQWRWQRQVWTLKLQSSWAQHKYPRTKSTWYRSNIKLEAMFNKTKTIKLKTTKEWMIKAQIWLYHCLKWVHHSTFINSKALRIHWKTSLEKRHKMWSGLIRCLFTNGVSRLLEIDLTSVSSKATENNKIPTTNHFSLIQASDIQVWELHSKRKTINQNRTSKTKETTMIFPSCRGRWICSSNNPTETNLFQALRNRRCRSSLLGKI